MKLSSDRLEAIALALIGVFAITLLTYPKMIGLADNGDFFRLMYWGKFEYPQLEYREQYIGWTNREYLVTQNPLKTWWGFPSSEAIFVKIAAILATVFLPRGSFDLRVLGVVHVLGFVVSCWLMIRGWRAAIHTPKLIPLAFLLFIFCDAGYLVYFQSFYGESASLIFLLAVLGLGLKIASSEERPASLLIAFYIAAFCFVLAKPQNIPFVLAILLFTLRLHLVDRSSTWRRANLIGATAIVLCSCVIFQVIPRRMKEANLYNSVFNGILLRSPNPAFDLADLGLSEKLTPLAGTSYFDVTPAFDKQSFEFRSAFYERMSPLRVIAFYLKHPSRYLEKLSATSERAYTLQPPDLGNFEKRSGEPFASKATRWTAWSRFKRDILPKSLWFTFAYLGLTLSLILVGWAKARRKTLPEFLFALWLMMLISFLIPIPGDGENDLEKHLFLFNALFDLSLLFMVGYLARTRRWPGRQTPVHNS